MKELVVILGAGPGLGRSIARVFAMAGHRVVLMARDGARLNTLAAAMSTETGTEISTVSADGADPALLRHAFHTVRDRHGDPTVLVHNISVAIAGTATSTSHAALMDGLAASAGSLLVSAQEVGPAMQAAGRGTLLVTGSGTALTGSTWSAALAAQKAAVRNLAFSLEAELRPAGIHVTTITIHGVLDSPGFERDSIAAAYLQVHQALPAEWSSELDWHS